MRYFCTYFDLNYLPRALALYRSLCRHASPFRLHALCFDKASVCRLRELRLPEVHVIEESELLDAVPRLADARNNRTRLEFYFTCTPALTLHVLDQLAPSEVLTYLDADLYFYSSPASLEGEMDGGSVLIYPHRFPWWLRYQEKYGRYNVGYLSFRHDATARECLSWWCDRCIEWCYDRFEANRFADQKYLDRWPELFSGVIVGRHPGAGLASWNLGASRLSVREGQVFVNGAPLVFHHFHGLRILSPFVFCDRLLTVGVIAGPRIVRHVYRPYLQELSGIIRDLNASDVGRRRAPGLTSLRGILRYLVSSYYVLWRDWWRSWVAQPTPPRRR